mmetsp:Transcript_23947/g.80445  ORF Transcript_23947/g.80445 Transcript_23947/m.80445 type:complete len:217 (+) Transcript_23947:306-956(+)
MGKPKLGPHEGEEGGPEAHAADAVAEEGDGLHGEVGHHEHRVGHHEERVHHGHHAHGPVAVDGRAKERRGGCRGGEDRGVHAGHGAVVVPLELELLPHGARGELGVQGVPGEEGEHEQIFRAGQLRPERGRGHRDRRGGCGGRRGRRSLGSVLTRGLRFPRLGRGEGPRGPDEEGHDGNQEGHGRVRGQQREARRAGLLVGNLKEEVDHGAELEGA